MEKNISLIEKKLSMMLGVSLRYKNIFNFSRVKKEKNILLIGSYDESVTRFMLDNTKKFDHVIFKNHPAVDLKKFDKLSNNIILSSKNIYKLFEDLNLLFLLLQAQLLKQ